MPNRAAQIAEMMRLFRLVDDADRWRLRIFDINLTLEEIEQELHRMSAREMHDLWIVLVPRLMRFRSGPWPLSPEEEDAEAEAGHG